MTTIPQQLRSSAPEPRPGGVATVLGSRREVLALAPVLCELGELAKPVRVGRRDTDGQDGLAGALEHLEHLERTFAADRPDAVLVRGATGTALVGALAARASGIPLVHVEAGLRCGDPAHPDEHTRVLLDRAADVLCAPTPTSVDNLRADGLGNREIRLTGTTAVESVGHRLLPLRERLDLVRRWGLEPDGYVLATIDRPENTDDASLLAITDQLSRIGDAGYPVVLAARPQTRAAAIRVGVLGSGMNLRVVNRLWHSEFLALAKHAGLLVSDSSAVQEEATVLKRPILVVGGSTERREVLDDFGSLVGPRDDLTGIALDWLADGDDRRARLATLPSPFGDDRSCVRIAEAARHAVPTQRWVH
ncbi:UDP-N-acetylglucosamine 2-epimerase [Actinokineospora sp. NPDC004072]